MVKFFIAGLISMIFVLVASFVTKSEAVFLYGMQILGFGSIVLGGIFSGLISDNIYRRTAVETEKESDSRINRAFKLAMFGLPSIVALIIYYFSQT